MNFPLIRSAYLLLLLSSLYSTVLVVVRLILTDQYKFFFLIWNLCLAWIPFLLALFLFDYYRKRGTTWMFWVLTLCWLLFLPNAFYLVTDFVHLRRTVAISFWFDLVMIASFAWNGLLLGMISLRCMHALFERWLGSRWGWLAVQGVLLLVAVGVYLGRFIRFNSWDVVSNPSDVGLYLAANLSNLSDSLRSYALILFFYLFFAIVYSTARTLTEVTQVPA
jgi:uncharacterized membrane protein